MLVASGCDWPMFGQNAEHWGTSADTSISATDVASGLTEQWRADLNVSGSDTMLSSPVVANGVVYVGTLDGRLMAFDAKGNTGCTGSAPRTCQPLWSATLSSLAITSTPAVANGVVYVGTQAGYLVGFDAAGSTGCSGIPKVCWPIWQSVDVGAIRSSPAVADGKVYVGSATSRVFAFAAAGGGCSVNCPYVNAFETNGAVSSSPAVMNHVLYVGSDNHNLYAFDATGATGCDVKGLCAPSWIGPTGGVIRGSPSVADGRVFIGSEDHSFSAFDARGQTGCSGTPKTCAPLWSATLPGGTDGSPAVHNGVVYIASTTDGTLPARVNAFDAAGITGCSGVPRTCEPLWVSYTISIAGQTPISVVNGVVYVMLWRGIFSGYGEIFAFDEAAGSTYCSGTPKVCTPMWSAAPSDTGTALSAVAVANGFVYVSGNQLHAFAKPA